jgi:hypothetical protein
LGAKAGDSLAQGAVVVLSLGQHHGEREQRRVDAVAVLDLFVGQHGVDLIGGEHVGKGQALDPSELTA